VFVTLSSFLQELDLFLHPFVLTQFLKQRQDILVVDDYTGEVKAKRHAAYCQYVFWKYGRLGTGVYWDQTLSQWCHETGGCGNVLPSIGILCKTDQWVRNSLTHKHQQEKLIQVCAVITQSLC
jgi:hypothetical protein